MSTLRNAEGAISGFIDRIFGRVFRGYVEPVELARKLAREMEDHKTVSVSRVYVPNEYVIYLSDKDHARFRPFESSLTSELGTYLAERARHEGFTLLSDPRIRIEVDGDLTVGAYGIACRVVDPPADEPAAQEADAEQEESRRPAATADDPFGPFIAATPPLSDADAAPPPVEADAQEEEGSDIEAEAEAEPLAPSAAVAAAEAPEGDADEEPEPEPEAVEEPEPEPSTGMDAEPEPSVDAEPEPEADVEPVPVEPAAVLEPDPEHAVWPAAPAAPSVPEPVGPAAVVPPPAPTPDEGPAPPQRPLPPPGGYQPLAGVSGTQIFESAQPDEGLIHEEVSLIIDGRRFRLTRRTTTLGRSKDCDIPVADPNASRQHAEIRHIGLDYFLVDQNSTNGTYVNGQRIRRHALADGDRIVIGTTEMIVEHVTMERG